MKTNKFTITGLLIIGIFLFSAGCIQDPSSTDTTPNPTSPPQMGHLYVTPSVYTSNETLIAFVESAAAYAKTHGSRNALSEFNNKNGSFIRGELYIYAYGFNGTTLAHPINPEKIGKIRDDEGAIGVFVKEMGAAVGNGSGFYRFTYINPTHNNTLESKLGYGVKVDDTWWLGSGAYTGPVIP